MPYFVKEVRNGFKVCKKTDPERCFSKAPLTEDVAKKQMTAINISEHGASLGGMIDKFLATAKEFAKKAGYEDWADLKRAPAPHKLELRGVAFGRRGYKDFIQYAMQDGDEEAQKKRAAYLARATKIKGDWRDDKYSPNSLAINILWGGEDELAGSGIILNAGLYTLGLIPFFRWSSPVFNFVPNPRLPSLKDMFEMTEESYITNLDDLDEDVNGFMLQERAETYKIYRKADVVVVAVRGTAGYKDVKAWTPVALGNVRSTERVDPDLHDIPLDLQEYKDDGCIIFGTGHSLAGVILDDLLKNGHLTQVVSFNPAVERQMLGNSNNIRFYMDGDPLLNIMGCRANNAIILAYQGTFDVLAGLFKPKIVDVDKHFITAFEGHLPSKYPTKIGIYTASDEAAALQKEGDDWEMVGAAFVGGIKPYISPEMRQREREVQGAVTMELLVRQIRAADEEIQRILADPNTSRAHRDILEELNDRYSLSIPERLERFRQMTRGRGMVGGASLGGIKENVITPLDDGDIRHNLGANAKILKYNELAGINSLDELLPGRKSFCVILYLDSEQSGHWVAVTRNASGVYFFDSYGGAPDSQLRWVPEATRDSLGVDGNYLTTILRTATQPVYYNKHDYQSDKDGVATCGRWCCLFIKKGMNCEDFYYFIQQQERKYKLNGDMLVSKLMPYD